MRDLLDWWFTWGAIVFLVISLFITALVVFDSVARKISATAWLIGIALVPVLILPSVIFKTQLDNPVPLGGTNTIEGTAEFFLWIGVFAGIAQVILAIGYFMLASIKQPPVINQPPYWPQPPQPPNAPPMPPTGNYPQPKPPIANGMLYLRNGGGPSRQYPLYQGRTTIGRGPANLLLIDDPDVSREHAVVQEQSGRFSIADLLSTHGTFVNGHKVRGQTYLQDSDEIQLGPSVGLVFKCW